MSVLLNTRISPTLPSITKEKVQKALLVTTVAFGVLTLLPPLRFVGSLGLRVSAFLVSANLWAENWDRSSRLDRCLMVGRIAFVALGIAGTILSSPVILILSIVADTALQMKGIIFSLQDKKWDQALIHLGMFLVDALLIAALAVGSWQLIVAASAISGALMLGIAIDLSMKVKEASDLLDVAAYMALAGIGIAGSILMAQIVHETPVKATFDLHNRSEYTQDFYAKDGRLIVRLAPGESVHLKLPYCDLVQMKTGPGGNMVGVLEVETPDTPWYLPSSTVRKPDVIDYNQEIIQEPIAPHAMLYTALGGATIATEKLIQLTLRTEETVGAV